MIDNAITSLLKTVTTLTAVGSRVYSGAMEVKVQQDLPKVLYTQIGNIRHYTDDGNTGLCRGQWQIDIFATLPSAAREIADNIRVGLDGYKGTTDGTTIERIWFDDNDRPEKPERIEGEAVSVSRFKLLMNVYYHERTT